MSISPHNLSNEHADEVDRMLRLHLQTFLKHNNKQKLSTADGLAAFLQYLEKTYNLALEGVGEGSLVIKVQCPNLKSLESLWNDYQHGLLNEAAERILVTDDIKMKLDQEAVRLKTTIEEENYLKCKQALMEKSSKVMIGTKSKILRLRLNW